MRPFESRLFGTRSGGVGLRPSPNSVTARRQRAQTPSKHAVPVAGAEQDRRRRRDRRRIPRAATRPAESLARCARHGLISARPRATRHALAETCPPLEVTRRAVQKTSESRLETPPATDRRRLLPRAGRSLGLIAIYNVNYGDSDSPIWFSNPADEYILRRSCVWYSKMRPKKST